MAQIPTLDDFLVLRHEIKTELSEIKTLLSNSSNTQSNKKEWLRSSDVKRLLNISNGKLQKMRDLGQISFKKVDNVIFYSSEAIEKMLNEK